MSPLAHGLIVMLKSSCKMVGHVGFTEKRLLMGNTIIKASIMKHLMNGIDRYWHLRLLISCSFDLAKAGMIFLVLCDKSLEQFLGFFVEDFWSAKVSARAGYPSIF